MNSDFSDLSVCSLDVKVHKNKMIDIPLKELGTKKTDFFCSLFHF